MEEGIPDFIKWVGLPGGFLAALSAAILWATRSIIDVLKGVATRHIEHVDFLERKTTQLVDVVERLATKTEENVAISLRTADVMAKLMELHNDPHSIFATVGLKRAGKLKTEVLGRIAAKLEVDVADLVNSIKTELTDG
jgi:hypothetical protein